MNKKELLFEFIIYCASVASMSLLWKKPFVLMFVCAGISLIILLKWHRKEDIFCYGFGFTLGPIAEIISIYFGAWKYTLPQFIIPVWLPFMWGTAALMFIKLTNTILKKNN